MKLFSIARFALLGCIASGHDHHDGITHSNVTEEHRDLQATIPAWLNELGFTSLFNFRVTSGRCGTEDLTEEEEQREEDMVLAWAAKTKLPIFPVTIMVHYHVIRKIGTGPSPFVAQDSIDVLNAAFLPWGFEFELATETLTFNTSWWNAGTKSIATPEYKAMKMTLKKGGAGVLNIYVKGGAGSLGWAYIPTPGLFANTAWRDGVVISEQTVPGGAYAPYNKGDTLTHQVGHWLGLHHTFANGCRGHGDYVADTPDEASPAFGCPVGRDSCIGQAGLDPIRNFMDYTDDDCANTFTKEQAIRMQAIYCEYRADGACEARPPTPPPTVPPVLSICSQNRVSCSSNIECCSGRCKNGICRKPKQVRHLGTMNALRRELK